ncbi:zinc finger, CCHC-type containing protein [Tanacetum coccineum]|uniref:Zinc finger, CCHC-type containing protein n=1 Tax=Tanacetum coccineum TaxID=301880 RepID=A0ABQ4XC60_9ASTR
MAEDSSNGQFQEDCRSGNKKNANAGVTGKTGLRRHSRPRLMRIAFRIDSGAYRFYVIEPNDSVSINSIIESKDAIFDENCFSLIPRSKDIIPNSDESQTDNHSNNVPSETPEPCKVALITTIRLLLALATIHNLVIHQMDVKTAFLNGDLDEEVYMKQPEGFVMPGNEHKKQTCITGSTMESEFVALAAAGKEAE